MKRITKIAMIIFIVIIAAGLYLFAADALYVDNGGIHFEMDNILAKLNIKNSNGAIHVSERNILLDLVPPGTVVAWAGSEESIPFGWLLCNGQEIPDTVEYADLRAILGHRYVTSSVSPEVDKYRVPDMRGMFLRGIPTDGPYKSPYEVAFLEDRGMYCGQTNQLPWGIQQDGIKYTTYQDSTVKEVDGIADKCFGAYYEYADSTEKKHTLLTYIYGSVSNGYDNGNDVKTMGTNAYETRPVNHGVYYIIKY